MNILKIFLFSIILFALPKFVNSEEVKLVKESGIYKLPVQINNEIKLNFILDTGASETYIPKDVFLTLIRTETIDENDILSASAVQLADGRVQQLNRVNLKSLQIGSKKLNNISAFIGDVKGDLLLGQNALEKLEPWMLNSKNKVFIFNESKTLKSSTNTTNKDSHEFIDDINLLINFFISNHSNKTTNNLINIYFEDVNYYERGIVTKSHIVKDKQSYFDKWDIIKYKLISTPSIRRSKYNDKIINTDFTIEYNVYDISSSKEVYGEVIILLNFTNTKNGYKINSEKTVITERKVKKIN